MLLVTGITGHCGRYFLQELINNKYEDVIRCIVREKSDTRQIDNSNLNIEKVVGSLEDNDFIERAMVGVNTVMHIYNIHHSPMIVEAAIRNNVKKVILVHTTGIYSKFKSASQEYIDIEKKVIDLTKNSHCSTSITILRPTMIYGDLCDRNMSKFIKLLDIFRIVPVIDGGESLLQPVNARDLGKAFFTVLMSSELTDGKDYDLSGDAPIRIIEAFKLISEELGKKVVFISIPLYLGVFAAKFIKILTLGRVDYIEKIQRMGEDRSYPHNTATRDFAFKPMSFKEGIHIEVQQYLRKKTVL